MDKIEKRKEIMAGDNMNSANVVFSQILEKKKSNLSELDIIEPLEGNLNLAILAEKGFIQIEILRFSPGTITTLSNLPANLKKLVIADNLLDTIDLPDAIEYVDLAHNVLKGPHDFIRNGLLKYIRVSYNNITSLENLSENVEELYCDHNLLRSLNLLKTPKLRILHCDYNPKLVLHDLPDTLTESRLPDQLIQTEKLDKTPKEYLDSVRRYFILKTKYENELMNLKRKAKESKRSLKTLPACKGCSKKVGMVFSGKDQKYTVYCGDSTKPCDWKIVIHRGDHNSFISTMLEMRENLEETKENMIRQKMDTLFQYITETKSADLFKKQMEFYKTNAEMVEKYHQDYLDIYFHAGKKEIVTLKQKKIQELMVELQEHFVEGDLEEVVRIQHNKIQPIAKYIQSLQYPLMEMEFVKSTNEWILDQKEMLLSDLEINHGEPISIKTI